MSREGWWAHECLNKWCELQCCQKCCRCTRCRKKPKDVDESGAEYLGDALLRVKKRRDPIMGLFGWMRPLGMEGSPIVTMQRQMGLLLWKNFTVKLRTPVATGLFFGLPCLLFIMAYLLYACFQTKGTGFLELYLVPFAFIQVLQATTSQIVTEKSTRLRESMRMMGLREFPYWASYFVGDGVIMGGLVSFLLSIMAVAMGLFNNIGGSGGFGAIFGFLFLYCVALSTMAFALSTIFDAPQTAGQVLTIRTHLGEGGIERSHS